MAKASKSPASRFEGTRSNEGTQGPGNLLLVDDEPRVCTGLKRILRKDDYRVYVAHNAEQALDTLARHPIDVIVSDQRMPGKKGTELLCDVSVNYPRTVRMILSGAAEVQDVADAMGAGVIYKYLTKPIEPALFRANVIEAFTRASTLKATFAAEDRSDPATGLPTRAGLDGIFGRLFEDARDKGKTVCLLMLTIDQYDSVVSSYGRSFAQRFLQAFVRKLTPVLDANEFLGHDAPGTLLMLLSAGEPINRIMVIDQELERLLSTPVFIDDRSLTVSLSIGATAAEGLPHLDALVDQAHAAMITGKERGGATIQIYQPHLVAAFRDQLELESDLRQAMAENAFELFYQPQVDIGSGTIVGLEALLRWRHAEHGFISPAKFIPVAERLGLIEELGDWVLGTALKQASDWRDAGVGPGEIAVNVSVKQARDAGFAERVRGMLKTFGIPPRRLVLEITESVAIQQSDIISSNLDALRELGVVLAVDDFGTGYANLGNLTRFAFGKLKLDRSLLPRDRRDERAMRLYANIVGMAQELGLISVAEGVETPGELAGVFEAGCRVVQGYFYSPPLNAGEIGNLLGREEPVV